MKKLAIIILLLLSTSFFVNAQNKEIEAIAAYQMAEEHFEKKEYIKAIESLLNATEILGTTNSKMLYLEVLAYQGLCDTFSTNYMFLEYMEKAIAVFEKAPDIEQFSPEKRVEVAKIKMSIPNRKQVAEQAEKQRKNDNKAIQQILALFPPCGVSLESFVAHPYASQIDKLVIRKNRGKKNDEGGTTYYLYDGFADNTTNERVITMLDTDNNNRVIFYKVDVEINENSVKETLVELLGTADYDNVFILEDDGYRLSNEEYWVFLNPEIKTSIDEHKRNKKRKQINYITFSIFKVPK